MNKKETTEKKKASNAKSFSAFTTRLSLRDQALFAKRLSLLVKAGMPVVQSINALKKQSKGGVKRMFEEVAYDVSNGQFLSKSMGKYRQVFGDFAVNIIKVGETSGTLSENLQYLAIELDKKRELKGKVVSALIYPAVILVASLIVTGMMIVFLFPKLMPIFQSMNAELPITTRILLLVSSFLINYWAWITGGIIFGTIGFLVLLKKSKLFRHFFDAMLIKIPLFGNIFRNYYLANTCRTLGLLLKGQLSAIEAVGVASDTSVNMVYRAELMNLRHAITKGSAIAPHLELRPKLFPPMLTEMVSVGESTGSLSETLLYIAKICEQELDEDTKRLSSVIEPAMMVFMGIMVGFVAVSIITPIYEITQHIGR